jgi:hypothetical protein
LDPKRLLIVDAKATVAVAYCNTSYADDGMYNADGRLWKPTNTGKDSAVDEKQFDRCTRWSLRRLSVRMYSKCSF